MFQRLVVNFFVVFDQISDDENSTKRFDEKISVTLVYLKHIKVQYLLLNLVLNSVAVSNRGFQ